MKNLLFVLIGFAVSISANASNLSEPAQQELKKKQYFVSMTVTQDGKLGFISGQLPTDKDGKVPEKYQGKVPSVVSIETGKEAAKVIAENTKNIIEEYCTKNNVSAKILKLDGMVNGVDGFSEAHVVMNGASDYLNQYYDLHARQALSYNGIPFKACAEISATVEFKSKL